MSEEKKGFFRRLVDGLAKTRNNIVSGIDSIFSGFSSIDEDFYEEIEEISGKGVCQGYYKEEELTSEKFPIIDGEKSTNA